MRTVVLVHGAWHGRVVLGIGARRARRAGRPRRRGRPAPVPTCTATPTTSTDVLDDLDGTGRRRARRPQLRRRGRSPTPAPTRASSASCTSPPSPSTTDETCSTVGVPGGRDAASSAMPSRIRDDGTAVLDPDAGGPALYGDCDADDVERALALLRPQPLASFFQPAAARSPGGERPDDLRRVRRPTGRSRRDVPAGDGGADPRRGARRVARRVALAVPVPARRRRRPAGGPGVRREGPRGLRARRPARRRSTVAGFGELVDALEDLRFDSLWLSERLTGDCPDPMIGLAFAAARSTKLKLGTERAGAPGAQPVRRRQAVGQPRPALGGAHASRLRARRRRSPRAGGVRRRAQGSGRLCSTTLLPKVRRLWLGEEVDGVRVAPLPVQSPPDVWLGGAAPDGAAAGRPPRRRLAAVVLHARRRRGRPARHRGRGRGPRPDVRPRALGRADPLPARAAGRCPTCSSPWSPPAAPTPTLPTSCPPGSTPCRADHRRFVAAGASKFVLVPVVEPECWADHLAALAAAVRPLEN